MELTTTKITKTSNYRKKLWYSAKKLAFPTAMWRLPNQTEKHFLTTFSERPIIQKVDFEEIGSGFAFAPFSNPNGQNSYFLKADLHFVFDKNEDFERCVQPFELDPNFRNLNQQITNFEDSANTNLFSNQNLVQNNFIESEKDKFISLVKKGIDEIEAGRFQKVVPSRTKKIAVNSDFEIISTFDKLCELYPTAFISAVSLPHLDEIWVGASPEILVSQDSNGIFKTMALAGTQSAFDKDGNLIKPSEAMWRQKEIEEQAFVSRYIINCLKKIRVREFEEIGPKTVVAGNLMHLKTEFLIDTQAISFPQLATVMLDLLHPTSAVCGMPKEPATEFILENESYDREFYSGFLGPVNINQASDIFVNLRTMKLKNNEATLYAGCGITADSDPEKEWQETEMKCQTLGRIFE